MRNVFITITATLKCSALLVYFPFQIQPVTLNVFLLFRCLNLFFWMPCIHSSVYELLKDISPLPACETCHRLCNVICGWGEHLFRKYTSRSVLNNPPLLMKP